jgi:hypothetical protein
MKLNEIPYIEKTTNFLLDDEGSVYERESDSDHFEYVGNIKRFVKTSHLDELEVLLVLWDRHQDGVRQESQLEYDEMRRNYHEGLL